jgi:2'-hydroxyisoflavone reductase
VRPTYVVGPGDETDRFTYWVARAAEGGVVVGPRADAKDLQTVDVRDLCPWMVKLIERDTSGIFNAAAPPEPWDRILTGFRPLSERPVRFVRPPCHDCRRAEAGFSSRGAYDRRRALDQ